MYKIQYSNSIYLVIIFLFFLFACGNTKELIKGEQGKESAIQNIILDHNRIFNNKFDVFTILDDFGNYQDNNFYVFSILGKSSKSNYNKFSVFKTDTLGKVPTNHLPNKYKEIENRVYLWNDKKTPLKKEVINILYKYNVLDSIMVKIELGILPEDTYPPIMRSDHKTKGQNYFVCKKDVSKFKKLKTVWVIPKEKYPKMKCLR